MCFVFVMVWRPPRFTRNYTLLPYTTLFRTGNGECVQGCGIGSERHQAVHLVLREVRTQRLFALVHQHRDTFAATLAVADRVIDRDLLRRAAILEEHLHRVADVALVGVEVVLGEDRKSTRLNSSH